MTSCDLCGASDGRFQVRIDGTLMAACSRCREHGEIVRAPVSRQRVVRARIAEPQLGVIANTPGIIKKAREGLGLTQEDLSRKLGLKESQLHKFETGIHLPDIETARKLERALRVRLVEEVVETELPGRRTASAGMTIGDILKQ